MARVVITSWGSHGDLHPYVGLALALRARGHHPVLALPPAYREAVELEGLAFRPVRPDVDIHDRALAARIMDPARGTDATFGEVLIPSLADSVADLGQALEGADLLVTHPASLAGPIVAEERGMPWASTVLAPMSFFSVHDPAVPAPAPWMHALTSRSSALSRLFRRQTERITRRWAEPVQRFRESRGLEPGPNPILEGQHSPFLVLALFSHVLAEPQPDWPAHTVVTGPVLYNGPGPDALDPSVEEFLRAGPPPVVFTLGTSAVGAAGSFYQVSTEAARRLGVRAILLAGRHPQNRPGGAGSDVLIVEYARHAALFPRAVVTVHQGGAGTLHQALRAGRPMLVVPWAHDQPDNAHRVKKMGAARTLRPRRYTTAALERELRRLLEEPSYRARASAIADTMRAESGGETAARALESIIG